RGEVRRAGRHRSPRRHRLLHVPGHRDERDAHWPARERGGAAAALPRMTGRRGRGRRGRGPPARAGTERSGASGEKGGMTESRQIDESASDTSAEMVRWLSYLEAERRMSPKTVEAYGRDVTQFLAFLTGHLGHDPSLAALAALTPADVRAFLAARRADGIGGRSLMRALAGIRSFARFLERDGKGKVGALAAVRA